MKRFHIEGLGYQEARGKIGNDLDRLKDDFSDGDMKAGRYLSVYYLMEAAARGDITSQVTLGSLYEFGNIVDQDLDEAAKWYRTALAQDHAKADGTMLAAGAADGMKRLAGKESGLKKVSPKA